VAASSAASEAVASTPAGAVVASVQVARDGSAPEVSGPEPTFFNRELSWLDFNARVLALAENQGIPLLERLKFLAIFDNNLDEFFQVRVAGLKEQLVSGLHVQSPDGLTPGEQIEQIRERVQALDARVTEVFVDDLLPQLRSEGILVLAWDELSAPDREHLSEVFARDVFPVLTPLSVDTAHPFPYISNLSLNLAVVVRDPTTRHTRFARLKVPAILPRYLRVGDRLAFVPLDQVIAAHLEELFPGMEIVSTHTFRITRNADLELEEDEADDLLLAVEENLRQRRLSQMVVRLEVDQAIGERSLSLLMRELGLQPNDVYEVKRQLGLQGLWELYGIDRPDLKEPPWTPTTQARLAPVDGASRDLFAEIRAGDILVHHPYDSFHTSVAAFVDRAARDPHVLAIKQTLYRTSGRESPIVRSLIRAANSGKQVAALVELKARFDEEANINWARVLEEAGVHVVYGLVGLKTHSKVTLVVRREGDQLRRYVHVGTGNYNPATATIYEDVGLLSADPDLGTDVTDLFNFLTGYSRQVDYRKLLVAPLTLRRRLTEMIEAQSRPGGRIVLKMNSLVDVRMIRTLYAASSAGAEIDLIVRGICCLKPGVEGLSDRIRVRSLVGRFLEHSRIFRFGADAEGPEYYIGSADLMPRNLDNRVEAVTPVLDSDLRAGVQEILDVELSDDVLAWELGPDGEWTKVPTVRGIETHVRLEEFALARAAGSPAPHAATPATHA
ncbi:MAG TPA: polyphosphate kinase 1, partial [Actinomycetota bacterium]|nr:polyphosphate kinase 1 [Actinomycetota bacterium]